MMPVGINNDKPEGRELNAFVTPQGLLLLEWMPETTAWTSASKEKQAEIQRRFQAHSEEWLFALGFCDQALPLPASLHFWRDFAGRFTRKLIQTPELESIRRAIDIPLTEAELEQILEAVPGMTGAEYISRELLLRLWQQLTLFYSKAVQAYTGSVAAFIRQYSPQAQLVGRVFFHLVENKNGPQPFAFLATYSKQLNQAGKTTHLPLKNALQEFAGDQAKLLALLATVQTASQQSEFIRQLLQEGELFHPLAWSSREAYLFLREIPLYEAAGILCRIPDWWKGPAASVRLNVEIGAKPPSQVGLEALLDFNARLMLGDMVISPEEARRLLEEAEGLALIKNKWVAVDHARLRQTLEAYEAACRLSAKEGFCLKDALHLQFHPEQFLGKSAEAVETMVSRGAWLESIILKLRSPERAPAVKPAREFKADLRAYQQAGLNWLFFLHSLGLGACLADDMGLGKTIQLLAFLSALRSRKGPAKAASLLVIPASLLANWTQEIQRFLPDLRFRIFHPSFNKEGTAWTQAPEAEIAQIELVITTYALAQRSEWLHGRPWHYVILDEAQAIKNPGTRQSQAVKKIPAWNRIILTGTPIENRVGDLWSLFDFLNPGLLGNKTEFSRFAKQLRQNPQGYARLRKVVGPYILRRLKTDKTIISDLPDKVEMKTYAGLSKKQILLYQNMVAKIEKAIETTEGIQRKGLILSALMKFKQLCNHPDQYQGSGEFAEIDSGKFARLREICETIYEKREKVLIFTQFREITEPLSAFLTTIFERQGLILHGGVPVGLRKKIVDQFQSDDYVPYMVLSLKAGGVGLNLTQANHVIHFDRWWNPAVENQATDRAFRIGQHKNVIVHKFITSGTVEEKIDRMIEDKLKLSKDVIAETGEAWITELSDNQLKELFTLTLTE